MKDFNSSPITPAELKLRTKLKTYFTTLEEDETPSFEDKVIMVVMGVLILWPLLLMAIAS